MSAIHEHAPIDASRWDLGRRAAHRRGELSLSIKEVARRAGMAPSYISYLEQHPPNLSRAALERLARALETSPMTLLGADTGLPPEGARTVVRQPPLEILDTEQSMALIKPGGVGRIAFSAENATSPTVLTLDFLVIDDDIVFRTAPRGTVTGHAVCYVSSQVDRVDGVMRQGWSVLVKGQARQVRDPREVEALAAVAHVHSWTGDARDATSGSRRAG
ncbi:helix-turn-helix domain-containing protein [Allosalinactinospora lopnorensis]|uniref:helix-turn-helix domain-containing protein n=1 Tax=Allosalinactinospora lopnorensis TaxID=1352348 RepID=UPI001F392819|nr:pyridoxamine 5'-phosphate oxidase family protein [Allosalinactinospora lopnorensis]